MYKNLFTKRCFAILFKALCVNKKVYVNTNCRHENHIFFKNFNSNKSAVKMFDRKQFTLSNYNIIGFDLDGTLLRYNLDTLVPLIYDLLIEYLVKRKSYPNALFECKFNPDFIQKGLIIDTLRGNVVKLASDGKILRASHGTRPLNLSEIEDTYNKNGFSELDRKFSKQPLPIYQDTETDKLYSLLDSFDYSAALVFAQAVDVIDETSTTQPTTGYNVWSDILAGLIALYKHDNFHNDDSYFYKAIKADPDRYLLRTSRNVLQWIDELRSAGKSLYLLTNSCIDYANFVSTYAMGTNWHELFDLVVCNANKPLFFKSNTPFLETDKTDVNMKKQISPAEHLQPNKIYSQGNWSQLYESLKEISNCQCNEPTLYIGDNLLQDVYAPSLSGIHTVAISEELLIDNSSSEFKNSLPSKYWGSYFVTDQHATHWLNTIQLYANLCIPKLKVLADLPINSALKFDNYGNFYPKLFN